MPTSEVSALEGWSDPRTRGHTGHEHLDRTGLIHRGGRVYDPTLGRFLSPDPLVGNPGSAQSWNGYSYVSNSPMSFVDPSGLVQAGPGCNIGPVMCLDGGGGGAAGGGFGVESVVSTYRYRYVDVFVSVRVVFGGIYGGGNGPGVLDGWWDFMDPFVEVYYEYIDREGSVEVTGQVGVVGTPNITGKPMGLPGIDFGYDDRLDHQALAPLGAVLVGFIVRAGVRLIQRKITKWVGDKTRRDAKQPPKPKNDVVPSDAVPSHVDETLSHIEETGRPLPGYRGGQIFQNDGRGGTQVLPRTESVGQANNVS